MLGMERIRVATIRRSSGEAGQGRQLAGGRNQAHHDDAEIEHVPAIPEVAARPRHQGAHLDGRLDHVDEQKHLVEPLEQGVVLRSQRLGRVESDDGGVQHDHGGDRVLEPAAGDDGGQPGRQRGWRNGLDLLHGRSYGGAGAGRKR
jgi:hypothetical protein